MYYEFDEMDLSIYDECVYLIEKTGMSECDLSHVKTIGGVKLC